MVNVRRWIQRFYSAGLLTLRESRLKTAGVQAASLHLETAPAQGKSRVLLLSLGRSTLLQCAAPALERRLKRFEEFGPQRMLLLVPFL